MTVMPYPSPMILLIHSMKYFLCPLTAVLVLTLPESFPLSNGDEKLRSNLLPRWTNSVKHEVLAVDPSRL